MLRRNKDQRPFHEKLGIIVLHKPKEYYHGDELGWQSRLAIGARYGMAVNFFMGSRSICLLSEIGHADCRLSHMNMKRVEETAWSLTIPVVARRSQAPCRPLSRVDRWPSILLVT